MSAVTLTNPSSTCAIGFAERERIRGGVRSTWRAAAAGEKDRMVGGAESTVNAGELNDCEGPLEGGATTRITVSVALNPLGVHGTIWGFVGPAAKDLIAWLAPPPEEYETLTWIGSPSGSVTSNEMSVATPPIRAVVAV